MIDVAGLVIELLSLADVADERLDAEAAVVGRPIGARRQLDPHGVPVGAAEPHEVITDRPVGGEAFEQRDARLRVDEALLSEGAHIELR